MSVFSASRRLVLRLGAAAAVAAALVACGDSKPVFKGSDITGTQLGRGMELSDHNGKLRQLSDFSGKVVVVFFGYTHCPDVCPTTMSELASAMKKLGADADKVQVLFVTADPERDTADILKQYVTAFDSRFLGLRGSPEQTAQAAKDFKVLIQKNAGSDPNNYTVDHSSGTYLYDREGKLRVYVSYGQGADVFAHDIAELLKPS
jgi:protein SCO1/2